MNKNHLPNLPDEQLDRLTRKLFQSTIPTDEEVDEIAASPRLWWQVKSRIAVGKSSRENRRFFLWSRQSATVGAFLILFGAAAAMWFLNSSSTEIVAVSDRENSYASETKINSPEIKSEFPRTLANSPATSKITTARQRIMPVKREKDSVKTASQLPSRRTESAARKTVKSTIARSSKTETATEFIALSYLPASESGQVVRVKVPRSMLVSLGVSINVERGKELINAEVVVGDDGAARAIRFFNE